MGYSDFAGFNKKSAGLNRQFLFPVLKVAGGIDLAQTYVHDPVDTTKTDRIVLGGWSGYCVKGNPGIANQYAYAAMSINQTWFRQRPEVSPTYGKLWHESLLAITALAVTQSEYKRLPYMYSLLENDDIPEGFLYELLMGYEFGEYKNREFLGIRGGRGVTLPNSSFLYLKGGFESFISQSDFEQGVFSLEPLYITPMKTVGKFHTRTFFKQRIVLGFNRFRGESLRLSTDDYFRGNHNLAGNNLISSGIVRDYVTPWDILGFRLSIFGFMDGSLMSKDLAKSNMSNVLITEGTGLRIRNPHLVWKSLELRMTANQNKGQPGSLEFALIAKVPLKLEDFEGHRPEPYTFK